MYKYIYIHKCIYMYIYMCVCYILIYVVTLYIILYYIILYYVMLYYVILYYIILLYHIISYYIILYYIIQYYIIYIYIRILYLAIHTQHNMTEIKPCHAARRGPPRSAGSSRWWPGASTNWTNQWPIVAHQIPSMVASFNCEVYDRYHAQ